MAKALFYSREFRRLLKKVPKKLMVSILFLKGFYYEPDF